MRQSSQVRFLSRRQVARTGPRQRKDLAVGGRGHPIEAPGELLAGGRQVSAETLLEPGALWARARLTAKACDFVPQIRADVGVSLRRPAGTRGAPAAAGVFDPERVTAQISAETVESDAGQRVGGARVPARLELDQPLLQEPNVRRRLFVRVASGFARIEPVEAAAARGEGLPGVG